MNRKKINSIKVPVIIVSLIGIVVNLIGVAALLFFLYNNNYYYSKKLIDAIEENDVAKVEKLVKSPFGSVNSLPRNAFLARLVEISVETPLQVACHEGNYEIIKLLVDNGADVNKTGSYKISPLQSAAGAKEERLRIVKLLVENGADVGDGVL